MHQQHLPMSRVGPVTGEMPKKMDITSLMSPPDLVLDSFSIDNLRKAGASVSVVAAAVSSDARSSGSSGQSTPRLLPMSPPVSPYSKTVSHPAQVPSTPPSQTTKDPVLYPADDGATSTQSTSQLPLFASTEIEAHQRIVDDHLRARSAGEFGRFEPPTREQYHLILTFRSQVMKHYKANPRGWLRKERALLEADRRAGAHRYHTIMPARSRTLVSAKPARTHQRGGDRVTKPASAASGPAPRPIRSGGGGGANPTNGNGISGTTTTTTTKGANSTVSAKRSVPRASPTPEPTRRIVAPNREDKDFNSLPDYCPPASSLPSRPNSLKVEWKGQPIDLSSDPHSRLLHPDEVALAGNLRLDCATYLTSKRRIFERRLQCLHTGKEFRKTDAQQACKIDVNKASKLWTAFDRVGWLDASWVQKFL
ncbi:SWIRM domain [Geosmithia morbida]|uniref:SWIRM domain n=1 Tax=Geosmithia morbida TaxID=1094350 RepID=A0A9P4YPX0_9HYPO|nr:SWIRM domain [Geosmithia morbida]KAF4119456.1 SWIRM domain [Geosmithia morbida]